MSAHTPGPWTLEAGTPDRRLQDRVNGPDGSPVAYTAVIRFEGTAGKQAQLDKFHEASANARLIAAAPELAEALAPFAKLFLYPDDIEGHDDEEARGDDGMEELYVSRKAIRAARAALAKAGL